MRRLRSALATVVATLSMVGIAPAHAQAVSILPAPHTGQAATAFPAGRGLEPGDFPRTVRIADGVYAYEDLRAPGFVTVSLFVVGTDGVLLADGQESPEATRRLLVAIAQVTDTPVRWYVVGSDHADHTGGNAVLPRDVTYLVHPASLPQIAQDTAGDVGASTIVMPLSQDMDLGGRTVRIVHLGRAHTGGDLMVEVPDAGVLFMSEVFFNRVFPAMRTARPTEWLATVDAALALDVRTFVPGHGFVEDGARSRAELVAFREAIRHTIDEAVRLYAARVSPTDAVAMADWGPFGDWMLADTQKIVAIRQVYAEIEERIDPAAP